MQTKRALLIGLLFLALSIALAGPATAASPEKPWYEYSLRPYIGAVNNAASIDPRDTYMPLKLGSDAELGIGFSMVLTPGYDLEFTLSELKSSGTQLNYPGSGNENNAMDISLHNRKLTISGKKFWFRNERPFVPWIGLGLDGSQITTKESEHITMQPGVVTKPSVNRVSTSIGGHGSAGLDVYPLKSSAFALSLEARYNIAMLNGPFKGDLNSIAVLVGIRWDFWTSTF